MYIYQIFTEGKDFLTEQYFTDIIFTTDNIDIALEELRYFCEDVDSVDGANGFEFYNVKVLRTKLNTEEVKVIKGVKLQ